MKELAKKLKKLSKLEAGGQPREGWVSDNKEILMSQIKPYQTVREQAEDRGGEVFYYVDLFSSLFKQRVFRPAMAFLMIIAVMLSYTAAVSVANASLPGDMLYPVKTTGEKVQLALTFNKEEQVQLQMNFLSRRTDELQKIVKKVEDETVKKGKIIQAVKQISQDVKSVSEKLNKITDTKETSKPTVVSLVKQVEVAATQIKNDIVKANDAMSSAVKNDVAFDVKAAIVKTEETSNSALETMIKKYQEGQKDISEDEIAAKVGERIKGVEVEINNLIAMVGNATTTVAVSSTSATSTVEIATSIKVPDGIASKIAEAQKILEEAKDLLDKRDFTGSLEKIKNSKEIVDKLIVDNQTSDKYPVLLPINADEVLGTTTIEVIKSEKENIVQTATSSAAIPANTSESTASLIK